MANRIDAIIDLIGEGAFNFCSETDIDLKDGYTLPSEADINAKIISLQELDTAREAYNAVDEFKLMYLDKEDGGTRHSTELKGILGAGYKEPTSGAKGNTGSAGAKGDIGATGPTGATGSAGAKGNKGDTGATGPQGATGSTGPQGSIGATGSAGAKGNTGSAGSNGTNGSDGATGNSHLSGITSMAIDSKTGDLSIVVSGKTYIYAKKLK